MSGLSRNIVAQLGMKLDKNSRLYAPVGGGFGLLSTGFTNWPTGGIAAQNFSPPSGVQAGDICVVFYCGAGGTVVNAAPTGWAFITSGAGFNHAWYYRIATGADDFAMAAQASGYGSWIYYVITGVGASSSPSSHGGGEYIGSPTSTPNWQTLTAAGTGTYRKAVSSLIRFGDATDRLYNDTADPWTKVAETYHTTGASPYNLALAYYFGDGNLAAFSATPSGESPNGTGSLYGKSAGRMFS